MPGQHPAPGLPFPPKCRTEVPVARASNGGCGARTPENRPMAHRDVPYTTPVVAQCAAVWRKSKTTALRTPPEQTYQVVQMMGHQVRKPGVNASGGPEDGTPSARSMGKISNRNSRSMSVCHCGRWKADPDALRTIWPRKAVQCATEGRRVGGDTLRVLGWMVWWGWEGGGDASSGRRS